MEPKRIKVKRCTYLVVLNQAGVDGADSSGGEVRVSRYGRNKLEASKHAAEAAVREIFRRSSAVRDMAPDLAALAVSPKHFDAREKLNHLRTRHAVIADTQIIYNDRDYSVVEGSDLYTLIPDPDAVSAEGGSSDVALGAGDPEAEELVVEAAPPCTSVSSPPLLPPAPPPMPPQQTSAPAAAPAAAPVAAPAAAPREPMQKQLFLCTYRGATSRSRSATAQLVRQVEHYFSDGNLRYDEHLLGEMRTDPAGEMTVPIADIARFPRLSAKLDQLEEELPGGLAGLIVAAVQDGRSTLLKVDAAARGWDALRRCLRIGPLSAPRGIVALSALSEACRSRGARLRQTEAAPSTSTSSSSWSTRGTPARRLSGVTTMARWQLMYTFGRPLRHNNSSAQTTRRSSPALASARNSRSQ